MRPTSLRALIIAVGASCAEAQHAETPVVPVVTVVDPGAAPRQRLRYALSTGTTERVTLDLKVRSEVKFTNTVLQNGQVNVDMPTLRVITRFDVVALDANGARVASEVEDAKVLDDVIDPRLRRTTELEVVKLRGMRETWHVTPTGRTSDRVAATPMAQSDPVPTAAALTRTGHVGAPIEFPDADLGVGATWRVTSPSFVGKVRFDDVVTYRITAIDGDTVSLRIELSSTAPDQAVSIEPNATTRVTSGQVHGQVDATVSLHQLVAVGAQHTAAELNMLLVRQHLRIVSTLAFDASFAMQHVASSAPGLTP